MFSSDTATSLFILRSQILQAPQVITAEKWTATGNVGCEDRKRPFCWGPGILVVDSARFRVADREGRGLSFATWGILQLPSATPAVQTHRRTDAESGKSPRDRELLVECAVVGIEKNGTSSAFVSFGRRVAHEMDDETRAPGHARRLQRLAAAVSTSAYLRFSQAPARRAEVSRKFQTEGLAVEYIKQYGV
ncbi:hypothetical protein POX_e06784 [Penicillium oxalicum]|uniref:hypothetical protein n=1 Tax=Penicillium oxalicum TaxID=69781 RepID=UPI0020B82BEA|nr:hypothetical protein POX_e06784 [Penicillium oxalicum]KAI2788763.1 hypothetical protein POX_e06784 [Penicillium oxalicum]